MRTLGDCLLTFYVGNALIDMIHVEMAFDEPRPSLPSLKSSSRVIISPLPEIPPFPLETRLRIPLHAPVLIHKIWFQVLPVSRALKTYHQIFGLRRKQRVLRPCSPGSFTIGSLATHLLVESH